MFGVRSDQIYYPLELFSHIWSLWYMRLPTWRSESQDYSSRIVYLRVKSSKTAVSLFMYPDCQASL